MQVHAAAGDGFVGDQGLQPVVDALDLLVHEGFGQVLGHGLLAGFHQLAADGIFQADVADELAGDGAVTQQREAAENGPGVVANAVTVEQIAFGGGVEDVVFHGARDVFGIGHLVARALPLLDLGQCGDGQARRRQEDVFLRRFRVHRRHVVHHQATIETEFRAAQFLAVGHLISNRSVLAVEHHTRLDTLAERGELARYRLGAGEAWRADDGQVFSDPTERRQTEFAPGLGLDAANHVVLRVGRCGTLFDDDHVDRHLDHFEDLVNRLKQRPRLSTGRVQLGLSGEAVDAKWGVFRNQQIGIRRGADQPDDVIAQATHGLGRFSGIDGDAVVLEVQNLSHGYSAFFGAAFLAGVDAEAGSTASVFFSCRRPALRNALASTSSRSSSWPTLDQWPPPVGNGRSTV